MKIIDYKYSFWQNMEHNPDNRNRIFVELFSSNYNRIRSFILTIVPNISDADDILQETSKIMWEKFDQFEIGTNFVSWAVTIAKYQALNFRKKYNPKAPLSTDLVELLADESEDFLEDENERLEALQGCLKKLQKKDMNLIKNRFVQRKTARELSKEIGVAMNTIYRNESRILSLLLNCIQQTLGSRYS